MSFDAGFGYTFKKLKLFSRISLLSTTQKSRVKLSPKSAFDCVISARVSLL